MLLRNYDNIMVARKRPSIGSTSLSVFTQANTSDFSDGNINVKNISGTLNNLYNSSYWYYNPLLHFSEYDITAGSIGSNGYGSSNLIAGGYAASKSGAEDEPVIEPVTYDDYKLSSYFTTSQVVVVSGTQKLLTPVYNEEDNSWTFTYQRTFSAKEDVVLREIGIVSQYYISNSGSFGQSGQALVYREVLDTPVEVPADASFVLTFTMTISANENKPTDYAASVSVE